MSVDVNGIQVYGSFDPKLQRTVELFAQNFIDDKDVGASLAISKDGEIVMDVWAGHLDEAKTKSWQENTIVNVYSSTKTVSFLCALVCADRGLLDFDRPVVEYWPEFGANGKEGVLLWHFMNHAAGLSGMDVPVSSEDIWDWDKMCGLLAGQAPWWEPGTASGYHGLTQGYLIGEVVRRVTGKSIGQFLQDEIAGPLDADFYIGVPEDQFDRIGNLIVPEGTNDSLSSTDKDSIAYRTFVNPAPKAEDSWEAGWRKAEIPAANGHGNARSLVRLQTPLACDGSAFGVDLLSAETARSIMEPRISGEDLALGVRMTFGLGFGLNRGPIPLSPNENTAFWGGWGGSSVVIDQDARMVNCFVMNKMFPGLLGDTRSYDLRNSAYQDLA